MVETTRVLPVLSYVSRDVREGLDACVGAIPWVHDRGDPNHSTIIRIRMYMYLTF